MPHGADDSVLDRFEQAIDLDPLEILDQRAHQRQPAALLTLSEEDQRRRGAGNPRLERSEQRDLDVRVAHGAERSPDCAELVGQFVGRVAAAPFGGQRQELANAARRYPRLVDAFRFPVADRRQVRLERGDVLAEQGHRTPYSQHGRSAVQTVIRAGAS